MPDVFGLVVLIATAALLAWCGIRAWRLNTDLLRSGGVDLAGLLATAVSSLSTLLIAGLLRLHARSAPVRDLKIAGTPAQIRRGPGYCQQPQWRLPFKSRPPRRRHGHRQRLAHTCRVSRAIQPDTGRAIEPPRKRGITRANCQAHRRRWALVDRLAE
jgi:hypothetical protein